MTVLEVLHPKSGKGSDNGEVVAATSWFEQSLYCEIENEWLTPAG
tara:strand:- start:151 stop:285 length:135 start_codon:yes stop_codon:yes gene_type:complete